MHLLILIFALCLTLGQISGYSNDPVQYHIQTDRGSSRYFRFQTYNGQYRKERRFRDGRVVGTYGWVDANKILRLYDYIADNDGYRLVRTRTIPVAKDNLQVSQQSSKPQQTQLQYPRPHPQSHIPQPQIQPQTHQSQAQLRPQPQGNHPQPQANHPQSQVNHPQPATRTTVAPVLRPLPVKRRKKPQSNYLQRKRIDYKSVRQRLREQQASFDSSATNALNTKDSRPSASTVQQHQQALEQPTINSIKRKARPSFNRRPVNLAQLARRRKPSPIRSSLKPNSLLTLPKGVKDHDSGFNPTFLKNNIPPDLGYDSPGGRTTIDFDLGIQYRREKIFPHNVVVGEHGYVDPMGILRITYYRSDSKGKREFKRSFWVGTRAPAS